MFPSMAEEETVTLLSKDAVAVSAEHGMSDDEFFRLYDEACKVYVAKYIINADLFDYHGEPDPCAQECRDKLKKLGKYARLFYESHMKFANSCLRNNIGKAEEIRNSYRNMLRCNLLTDLMGLIHGAWGIYSEENDCWNIPHHDKYDPFEKGMLNFVHSVASADKCYSFILKMRKERLEGMRECMLNIMLSDDDRDRDILTATDKNISIEQIRLFREAERMWDFYFNEAKGCHTPVMYPGIGSGVVESELSFEALLLRSHMEMLIELLQLRNMNHNAE